MAPESASDRRQRRYDRYNRRSDALARVFGMMKAYENDLPDGFKKGVVESCEREDVEPPEDW